MFNISPLVLHVIFTFTNIYCIFLIKVACEAVQSVKLPVATFAALTLSLRTGPSDPFKGHVILDLDCSRTIKTIMGLPDKVQLWTLEGMCTLTVTTIVRSYSKKCFIDKQMLMLQKEVIEKKSTRTSQKYQTEAWRVCYQM